MAVVSLIIFGICVVLFIWNKIPMSVTALLGLVAMVLTGAVSFEDGFKNFAGSTALLICSMMVAGKAAFSTGLAAYAGRKVIALARGNERLVVVFATAMTALLSAFLPNIATLAIMISVLTGVCAGNARIRYMNVIMPVSMAAVLGGAITLSGSTTQLTAQGILESYLGKGNGFSFFTFLIPGGIIVCVLILYVGIAGYPLGKKIWGKREYCNMNPEKSGETKETFSAGGSSAGGASAAGSAGAKASESGGTENKSSVSEPLATGSAGIESSENVPPEGRVYDIEPPVNTGRMRVMAAIFVITVLMFAFCDRIAKVIPGFNLGVAGLICALACVLTGCVSHREAIKSINFSLVIWFCSTLGIAGGVIESGGGDILATWFERMLGGNISPFALYSLLIVLVVILTQFISNSTVLAIVLPVAFSITGRLGYNTYSFAVGLTIAAAVAVATPMANATIGMSLVAGYKFGDYVKYAGPMTVLAVILLIILVPVLYPLA